MKDVENYIESVQSGKRNAGELEKLAVKRFLKLKKHKDYYFDEDEVNKVFEIAKLFKHTSGDYYKKPFTLLPWQKFTIANIFGLKKKKTDKRLIRKAYLGIAKKNGKTEFAGFLGLYFTFFDGEKGAEVYSAANKYDQAAFSWKAGRIMAQLLAQESPTFNKVVKIYDSINTRSIVNLSNESIFKPIGKDSKTLDGIKASASITDEFHEAKDDSLLRNLESSMVNRSQPLSIIITTAGFNILGTCHQYEKVCEDILKEKKTDDSTFALIFRADKDDDWEDPATWEKSNPSLGVTPTLEGLETEYTKAKNDGSSAEIAFKTKNLNMWVQSSEVWIKDRVWKKKQTKWTIEDMKGRLGFMAIDLSSWSDITCIGALFPPEGDEKQFRFYLENFIPEDTAIKRSKKDGVPYMDWHKEGLVNYTPGDWTDFGHVQERILELLGVFNIRTLAYDQWQADSTAQTLIKEGIGDTDIRPFRQTVTMFNEPIKFLEKMVNKCELDHGNNKVLRWMASNVKIYRNTTGLMKFSKESRSAKIDGMVVLAMCVGDYLDYLKNEEEKAYENHGVRYL